MEKKRITDIHCPNCGAPAKFDIIRQRYLSGYCGGSVGISEALQHRGWQHIHIDEEHMTVYIDDPDISFDAGGIAKGYAAEKLAQLLQEDGAETAVVNAGRNIRTIGTKPGNAPWVISVASPAGDGTEAARIRMTGSCSFVTSGDYEKYYAKMYDKR